MDMYSNEEKNKSPREWGWGVMDDGWPSDCGRGSMVRKVGKRLKKGKTTISGDFSFFFFVLSQWTSGNKRQAQDPGRRGSSLLLICSIICSICLFICTGSQILCWGLVENFAGASHRPLQDLVVALLRDWLGSHGEEDDLCPALGCFELWRSVVHLTRRCGLLQLDQGVKNRREAAISSEVRNKEGLNLVPEGTVVCPRLWVAIKDNTVQGQDLGDDNPVTPMDRGQLLAQPGGHHGELDSDCEAG